MVQYQHYLKLLISELLFSQNWISSHVSDHSAIHHRTQIVHLLLAECQPNTTPAIMQASSSIISDYLLQLPIYTSDNDKDSSTQSDVTRGDAQCLFQHLFHVSKTLIHMRVGYEALCIDVSTSAVVHTYDGGPGNCDEQVYFELSQLLCDEAAFISQLSSQEGNLPHAEDSRQRLYSLRCFAHLLMVVLEDINTSNTVDMTENGDSKNFGQKGQLVWWLRRECTRALKDITAYLVTLDPVNRFMYAHFQDAY
eukprot:gene35531-47771_t